jgi:hypothetical protein
MPARSVERVPPRHPCRTSRRRPARPRRSSPRSCSHADEGCGPAFADAARGWQRIWRHRSRERDGRADLIKLAALALQLTVDPETLDAVPECVKAFLAFMHARGSLSGEPLELEVLEEAIDVLGKEFKTQAQDSSRWGLAKSMFMRMQTEGVDPSRAGASDAWMDDFNSRPREERDAIISPPPTAWPKPQASAYQTAAGHPSRRPSGAERKRRHESATGETDPLTPAFLGSQGGLDLTGRGRS